MTTLLGRTLPVGALLVALLAGTARADTLILKGADGGTSRIEGRLVERRQNEFVFEHVLGGIKVRSTFARADVVSVLVDVVNAPLPATRSREPAADAGHGSGEKKGPGAVPDEFPELASDRHIVIVLDRSNAMLVGNRFRTGLDIVDLIVDHLPAKATFGVYIYDEAAFNVFGTNYVAKTEGRRRRLRATLETFGVNPYDPGDIRAGLKAAFSARPDAVYLISAGALSQSQDETAEYVKLLAALHPKSKKFPVHVVSVLGGKPADSDDGTEGRRSVLEAIATGLDGVYREVLLAAEVGRTQQRRGGGRPKGSTKTTGATAGYGPSGGRGMGMDRNQGLMGAYRLRQQQQGQQQPGTV